MPSPAPAGKPITLKAIITQWNILEADFHEFYTVDLEDVWRRKSWRWFIARVFGVLACDSRLHRHFAPKPKPSGRGR